MKFLISSLIIFITFKQLASCDGEELLNFRKESNFFSAELKDRNEIIDRNTFFMEQRFLKNNIAYQALDESVFSNSQIIHEEKKELFKAGFICALKDGHIPAVRLFFRRCADSIALTEEEKKALLTYLVITKKGLVSLEYLCIQDAGYRSLLLQNNNIYNHFGHTLLFSSLLHRQFDTAKILSDCGASLDAENKELGYEFFVGFPKTARELCIKYITKNIKEKEDLLAFLKHYQNQTGSVTDLLDLALKKEKKKQD